MGLEFETAARATEEDSDKGNTFKLDGEDLRYYRPTTGQISVAMAMTERRKSSQSKVAGLIDFFFSIFDAESQQYLQARLLDRDDPFDVDSKGGINDILDALYEEWAGRPTRRSIDSSESPSTNGQSSSPATPESISSDSAPISS